MEIPKKVNRIGLVIAEDGIKRHVRHQWGAGREKVVDPLAIDPGMRPDTVPQVAVAIGIASNVQPITPPAFAVVWRRQ